MGNGKATTDKRFQVEKGRANRRADPEKKKLLGAGGFLGWIEYPAELHKEFNAYPLAPEKIAVEKEWLSEYQTNLMRPSRKKRSCYLRFAVTKITTLFTTSLQKPPVLPLTRDEAKEKYTES